MSPLRPAPLTPIGMLSSLAIAAPPPEPLPATPHPASQGLKRVFRSLHD